MHLPPYDPRLFSDDAYAKAQRDGMTTNIGYRGGCQTTPPEPVARQVPQALDGLEKQLACTIDLMGELTERLGSILKPEPPACGGSNKLATDSGRSPVADRIDVAGCRAGEIGDLIRRILGRLDI